MQLPALVMSLARRGPSALYMTRTLTSSASVFQRDTNPTPGLDKGGIPSTVPKGMDAGDFPSPLRTAAEPQTQINADGDQNANPTNARGGGVPNLQGNRSFAASHGGSKGSEYEPPVLPDGVPAEDDSTSSEFPNFKGPTHEEKTVKPDAEKPTKEEIENMDETARIKLPRDQGGGSEPYPTPT